MVWFQCESCGENLKKPKLASHFRRCPARNVSASVLCCAVLSASAASISRVRTILTLVPCSAVVALLHRLWGGLRSAQRPSAHLLRLRDRKPPRTLSLPRTDVLGSVARRWQPTKFCLPACLDAGEVWAQIWQSQLHSKARKLSPAQGCRFS